MGGRYFVGVPQELRAVSVHQNVARSALQVTPTGHSKGRLLHSSSTHPLNSSKNLTRYFPLNLTLTVHTIHILNMSASLKVTETELIKKAI